MWEKKRTGGDTVGLGRLLQCQVKSVKRPNPCETAKCVDGWTDGWWSHRPGQETLHFISTIPTHSNRRKVWEIVPGTDILLICLQTVINPIRIRRQDSLEEPAMEEKNISP